MLKKIIAHRPAHTREDDKGGGDGCSTRHCLPLSFFIVIHFTATTLSTLPRRHRCSCCRLRCHRCLLLLAAAYLIVILCACRRHGVTAAITSVAIRQFPPPLPYQSCRRCRSRAAAAIVRSPPPAAPSRSRRHCHHCAAAAVAAGLCRAAATVAAIM